MGASLHLARDILDKQLVDREGRRMGKCDGLVVQPRAGKPPRVVAIETGPSVLANRLHPGLGRGLRRWLRRIGPEVGEPLRVPFDKIFRKGLELHLEIDATRCNAYALERWLAERVIGRIPGASGPKATK